MSLEYVLLLNLLSWWCEGEGLEIDTSQSYTAPSPNKQTRRHVVPWHAHLQHSQHLAEYVGNLNELVVANAAAAVDVHNIKHVTHRPAGIRLSVNAKIGE